MADNVEEIQKSIKKYLWIGLILMVFTAITVWLSTVELPTHGLNILVGMIVATFKAGLVALIFMHLNHERPIIYKVLAFTAVFAIVLFVLFYFSKQDPLVFEGFYSIPE
ncbi:MAG: cytochrome C oxidase subunit IV family protein [Prosthecobacter sp.]|jgi:caa(3)-type oxidase subunit IV|uniref:cytochrome C oxidase subunit IV family protein n=1 Tax=Prosthecobacter sp. TaxID=1965333 RepID=UPI0019ECEFC7|nr:cytochrome C oxidase subunit IV family protein [Prosthecobacter sp.]MBE2284181.1 cytochrome C oxidase subunit IV family protein [Prosthecobacter sp.]